MKQCEDCLKEIQDGNGLQLKDIFILLCETCIAKRIGDYMETNKMEEMLESAITNRISEGTYVYATPFPENQLEQTISGTTITYAELRNDSLEEILTNEEIMDLLDNVFEEFHKVIDNEKLKLIKKMNIFLAIIEKRIKEGIK